MNCMIWHAHNAIIQPKLTNKTLQSARCTVGIEGESRHAGMQP